MNTERHLDPPEDNGETCEDCGGEMEDLNWQFPIVKGLPRIWSCMNRHCPSKFEEGTTAYDMAVELVDLYDTVARLRRKIKDSAK